MVRFNKIIQVLFLTTIISLSGFAKIAPVAIVADFEGEMICQWFYPDPPHEGDGGSRVYEPPKHHLSPDESLFQV